MGPHLYECGRKENAIGPKTATGDASMGPHLYERGRGVFCCGPVTPPTASMGPHLYECGRESIIARLIRRCVACQLSLQIPPPIIESNAAILGNCITH